MPSDAEEGEVFVRVEKAVMPVENQVMPRNLLAPVHDQLQDRLKVLPTQRKGIRVYVLSFKCCVEELTALGIVAVSAQHADGDVQALQHFDSALFSQPQAPCAPPRAR